VGEVSTRRVVVTGAAGFIGSNLVRALLDSGFHVVAIDDLSSGTFENVPPGADFRKVDVRSPDLGWHLRGAETVFHLAAKSSLTDCAADMTHAVRVNVAGTANALEASVREKVSHFVFADTSAEYEGVPELPNRVDRIRPVSVYACTKRAAALLCEAASRLHGITVTVLRYFNVYGPAQDWRKVVPPVMSAFTLKLLAGEAPRVFGNGAKTRDFIHVDDLNAFHLKILREPAIRGRIYNLGTGRDHSIIDVYRMIERELMTGLEPQFAPDRPGEAERSRADITETLATGWRPRVELRDGLRAFIAYSRERMRREGLNVVA
jgi:UDP-glucose 4-epimerase